jgi:hypothetical protein
MVVVGVSPFFRWITASCGIDHGYWDWRFPIGGDEWMNGRARRPGCNRRKLYVSFIKRLLLIFATNFGVIE